MLFIFCGFNHMICSKSITKLEFLFLLLFTIQLNNIYFSFQLTCNHGHGKSSLQGKHVMKCITQHSICLSTLYQNYQAFYKQIPSYENFMLQLNRGIQLLPNFGTPTACKQQSCYAGINNREVHRHHFDIKRQIFCPSYHNARYAQQSTHKKCNIPE